MRGNTKILLILSTVVSLWAATARAQTQVAVETSGDVKAVLELKGDPERGKAEFRDCGGCHRKNASGRANLAIPRLSGQHASVIIKQIVDIRAGRRINTPMKPILDAPIMTPQSFADIASYLEGLPIPATKDNGEGNDLERGKALYNTNCAACHGSNGEGRADSFFPMLAGQHYSYLLRELGFVREGFRGNSNPAMAAILASFSQEDLQAVAGYIAHLPPPEK
jgi:cytochrome c553